LSLDAGTIRRMNLISAIFVILTAIVLGLGWWVTNRKQEPPRRRVSGESPARRGAGTPSGR
jgi:hypothetical protein